MDGLFLAAGVRGISPPGISAGGGLAVRTHPGQVSALCRSAVSTNASGISVEAKEKRWNRNDEITLEGEEEDDEEEEDEEPKLHPELTRSKKKRGNWVLKILHVRSLWTEKGKANVSEGILEKIDEQGASDQDRWACCDEDESDGCSVDDVEVDRDSFCRLLRRVSLMEANLYSQMSYLCNLAYHIPKIKPGDLLKHNGLRLVTSSLKKKALSANAAEKEPTSAHVQGIEKEAKETEEAEESQRQRKQGYRISASAAYQIAAAAASFLQSQSKSILPSKIIEKELNKKTEIMKAEVASLVATTNSVTAVVAAKEEMKQAVAEDLNSSRSSPCEWFICDDESGGTRFFVIQGSESLASWQANLLFEPVRFEGLDVLVHRGIYEAAKGIYEQMLPEVQAHLKSRGGSATLRFTGHSLGGSLSLLVNLMLLIRGEAPLSSLLPVVTFGSPSIMCGGDYLLLKLGLPRSHVQAIMMHRDIVPRAFSCNYPDHVAELLKAVNGNFRNHPCLNNQKLLYAPIGELLILQPEEKLSPHHHLLPSASGLYLFVHPLSDSDEHTKEVQAAQAVFLNSPHPLEILSDPSAYGSEGSIYRDHDMNSYSQSIRNVISREVKQIRKAKREHRRQAWWPLIAPHGVYIGDPVEQQWPKSSNVRQGQLRFLRAFTIGRESFGRFGRLIASQHIHMLVVLLFPARLLLIGWSIRFHCTVNTTFLR